MKRIVIVGGGIAGTFAAIRIKENHHDYLVSIFEHNDKLLKKIYATGNGKCNFANQGEIDNKYHNQEFVEPILSSFTYKDIISYFYNIGVVSKEIGNLIYPYSESAETVANKLLQRVDELHIDVHLDEDVKDYDEHKIITNKGEYPYDALIISVGGKSSPQLGSDGSFFSVLERHGYEIRNMNPSLCPIVCKENTKKAEGLRHKGLVSLYQGKKLVHQEEGEILFKKDGLSGIVIFNMSHYINELNNKDNVYIEIDFAPNQIEKCDSLLHPKLAKYLLDNQLDIHHTKFAFKKFYDYQFSQVTSGGIGISNLTNDLSSKIEKNVFFIGEAIDVNAVCGGFNIMWALSSAYHVSQKL